MTALKTIEITIKERIATVAAGTVLVCDNPTDTVRFNFDEEWSERVAKTARFAYGGSYIDVPFTGDEVQVPDIHRTDHVNIGVYANDLTSTYVKINCRHSVKSLGGNNPAPDEDIYNQVLMLIDKVDKMGVLRDYELIESITVEEDVFSVIRTTEPNGDALSLSHLYLKFTSPAYTENRVVYFAIGNTDATDIWTKDRLMYGADAGIINKNGYTTEVFCEKERGIFRNWMLLPANKVNQVNARCNHSIRTGSIKAIRIFAFSNTTDLIPAGTKIDIYGVRE